ncbi:hypothetical protein HPB48_000937 [Haemaphysalis longicornis]|uniref:Gamma-interferon inducible lysosomal thiol reductase n=1 Tax=Haemaphysalis longicornis TaxID=44386 RepID=A0A9J6FIT5_HAELO|nr:hypothetical protein HPB48_000937 [Haemaphysalis longicornis]
MRFRRASTFKAKISDNFLFPAHTALNLHFTAHACVQDPKVVVEVFYETYCPDSRSFILDQLNSTYAELSNIITLQLVPYGKAVSCVIEYYPDPKEHLPLVVCMFASRNPNGAYESCATKQEFDLVNLQKCVSARKATTCN